MYLYHLFHSENGRQVFRGMFTGAVVCLIAAVAYLVAYKLSIDPVQLAFAETGNATLIRHFGRLRSEPNDFSGLLASLVIYFITVGRVLAYPEPILPLFLKILSGGIILSAIAYWHRASRSHEGAASRGGIPFARCAIGSVVALLLLGSPIHLLIADNWIPPHVLMHVAAIWAVLFLAVLQTAPARWRRAAYACVSLYALGLGVTTVVVLEDIYGVYRKDLQMGERIVAELRKDPGFDAAKPLAVVGRLDLDSSYMADAIVYFSVNATKFSKEWSKYEILEEASGQRFIRADGDFLRSASVFCEGRNTRPRHYEATVTDEGLIVCLGGGHNRK